MLAFASLLATVTSADGGASPSAPPALQLGFSAVQFGYSWATGAMNATVSGPLQVDAKTESVAQLTSLPDGRASAVIFNYQNDSKHAGVFSLQPFFTEHVCYIYPLPADGAHQESFAIALEELWCGQAAPCVFSYYSRSNYKGKGVIFGVPCQLWSNGEASPTDTDVIDFCVTDEGLLLSVNRTVHLVENGRSIDVVSVLRLANVSSKIDPSAFNVPNVTECVDLRAPTSNSNSNSNTHDWSVTAVNDESLIARSNEEAQGGWVAGPSSVFSNKTLQQASARLGLRMGAKSGAFTLPPPAVEHVSALSRHLDEHFNGDIPDSFDARTKWGEACVSIVTVRNQGDCGSCWAFSAVETLADRFCIADPKSYGNLTLSPQYVLDCDEVDMACGGGLLDDAWKYLERGGTVTEACDGYDYCAHPNSPSCEVGPHPNRPTPTRHVCPGQCSPPPPPSPFGGGSTNKLRQYKAATAYAVATPGDVAGIQKEILAHGPIQVGFQVFSDFMQYHNGTYKRTAGAQGPLGGHAVKIVGWGADASGVKYWTVANSWSADWGMKGFFNIVRGSNECGIETTPAAGLPLLSV